MKILILSPDDEFETHALETIETGIKRQVPSFSWVITTSVSIFESELNSFKITTDIDRCNNDFANLKWPKPVKIIKDNDLKARIWDEIQTVVIPQFELSAIMIPPLSISNEELQFLLKNITDSSSPFTLKLQDSRTVGVNTVEKVFDINLTSKDIASMLAASWIFGSKQIRIPKDANIVTDKFS